MRLHTNYEHGPLALLREAREAATARHRGVSHMSDMVRIVQSPTLHGSRSHRAAVEFQLYYAGQKVPGDGRRWKNTGQVGAGNLLAATYAEHGWFLAHVFAIDPAAQLGDARNGYANRDEFNRKTRNEFWLDTDGGETIASVSGFGMS